MLAHGIVGGFVAERSRRGTSSFCSTLGDAHPLHIPMQGSGDPRGPPASIHGSSLLALWTFAHSHQRRVITV